MKKIILPILLFCLACQPVNQEKTSSNVVTQDINNFWNAYDKITATSDSAQQYQLLQELFLDKGSPGLKAMGERRRYTPQMYIDAINSYPKFWASIRANTLKSATISNRLEEGVRQLKELYPELKPAKIYFTIGALRSNGTTMDSLVLIGSELAMGDRNTDVSEFPDYMSHLTPFFANNPIDNIFFLNIHEYVHTQQHPQIGYDLLSQCLLEGVAEFVAAKATNLPSKEPCILYGNKYSDKVKQRLAMEVGSPHWNDWLYNDFENIFGVRDMGYYVGYAIAQAHYDMSSDKQRAIKELIELNYGDQKTVESFIDKTNYFSKPIETLRTEYEAARPQVVKIFGIENGAQNVDPKTKSIRLEISAPLIPRFRNQRIGPLGVDHLLPITSIDLAEDGKSITYGVDLKPNKRYQLSVTDQYRDNNGRVLQPYLIDFKTGG